jgi:hypothetical protein
MFPGWKPSPLPYSFIDKTFLSGTMGGFNAPTEFRRPPVMYASPFQLRVRVCATRRIYVPTPNHRNDAIFVSYIFLAPPYLQLSKPRCLAGLFFSQYAHPSIFLQGMIPITPPRITLPHPFFRCVSISTFCSLDPLHALLLSPLAYLPCHSLCCPKKMKETVAE